MTHVVAELEKYAAKKNVPESRFRQILTVFTYSTDFFDIDNPKIEILNNKKDLQNIRNLFAEDGIEYTPDELFEIFDFACHMRATIRQLLKGQKPNALQ
jgi:hypothetical protein